jgi:hypothetical protein
MALHWPGQMPEARSRTADHGFAEVYAVDVADDAIKTRQELARLPRPSTPRRVTARPGRRCGQERPKNHHSAIPGFNGFLQISDPNDIFLYEERQWSPHSSLSRTVRVVSKHEGSIQNGISLPKLDVYRSWTTSAPKDHLVANPRNAANFQRETASNHQAGDRKREERRRPSDHAPLAAHFGRNRLVRRLPPAPRRHLPGVHQTNLQRDSPPRSRWLLAS